MAGTATGRPRLLFCSYHSYFDPSSGAALSTRDLLEMLVARGWSCGVLCGPQMDFEQSLPLEQLFAQHGLATDVRRGQWQGTSFTLYHFVRAGVPVTLYHTPRDHPHGPPARTEGEPFLALFDQVVDRFRPDLLLTYGGHWLAQDVMARARRLGLRVIFALHNFEYHDARLFQAADAVKVPSHTAQQHYQRTLGVTTTALPGPIQWERAHCPVVEGRFVTFVNPQPHKGVFVFARLALELGRRRPDIPLLVVEGRSGVNWLGRTGLDLRGLTNLHMMANTPDPRDFYRVSRLVLMPSLWRETFGRVAAEALLNGIPVLASRRGALPETLAEAGLLFTIPERYTPSSRVAPSAEEVAPWLEAIERLWDDPGAYERERLRCLRAAEFWRPEALLPRFEAFFTGVQAGTVPAPLGASQDVSVL